MLYHTHFEKQRERYEEVKAYVEKLSLDVLKETLINYMMSEYDDEEDEFNEIY